jgi:hypothetical protein
MLEELLIKTIHGSFWNGLVMSMALPAVFYPPTD